MLFTAFIWQKSICLFISIPYPNQYDQQRKKYFSVVICVLYYVMLQNIYFPRMAFSSNLWVVPKKIIGFTILAFHEPTWKSMYLVFPVLFLVDVSGKFCIFHGKMFIESLTGAFDFYCSLTLQLSHIMLKLLEIRLLFIS